MNEGIFVCIYSEKSHRHAIFTDDGVTGILYLHAPSDDETTTGKVEASCFAYNRIDPIDTKEVQRFRPNPPPIAKGYASKDAVCLRPESHEWKLDFSRDGVAVLLLRDGAPWAMVSLVAPWGYSKAIEALGPWGGPWSEEVAKVIEWGGRTKLCS